MARIILDLDYVDELIRQRRVLHGGLPGGPKRVDGYKEGGALNRSCILMLSAQLQTFVEAIFLKASRRVLPALGEDEKYYLNSFARWGNPNPDNIKSLFARIGIENVISGLSWQRCPTEKVTERLRNLNELRNGIAHGAKILKINGIAFTLTLKEAENYRSFCSKFAENFEDHALARAKNG